MREIKFRGKRVYNGEWVYGDLLHRFKLTEIYQESGTIPVIPETVGQFTGCFDKNGTEIYEGDQLHICAGYSSVVKFQDAMFVSVYSHPEDGEIIPLLDAIGKDTVIIGDIF